MAQYKRKDYLVVGRALGKALTNTVVLGSAEVRGDVIAALVLIIRQR